MTEILTESFCERCGTRYTFESTAPRRRRIGGLKVLGRGLKNFVMSDDTPLDEAIASARSDVEREASAHQLDAFHRTFNFCMSCRQYTCANCWNEPEARCLSCTPLALPEAAPFVAADVDPERLLRFVGGPAVEAPEASVDVPARAVAAAIEAEAPAAATIPPVTDLGEVPVVQADQPEIAVVDPRTIGGLAPGQSLDDALAAYDASYAGDAVAERELEPVAPAAAEPEAEPVAPAAAEPEAATGPAAAPGIDIVDQPVWPVAAAPAAATESLAPEVPAGPPQWPTGPRWPTSIPARQAPPTPAPSAAADPLASLMARTSTEAMWAASNREILQPVVAAQPAPSVQPCVNCGISLSANARFCRRCGTQQG